MIAGGRKEQSSVGCADNAVIVYDEIGSFICTADRSAPAFAVIRRAREHHTAVAILIFAQEEHPDITVLHIHKRYAHDIVGAKLFCHQKYLRRRKAIAVIIGYNSVDIAVRTVRKSAAPVTRISEHYPTVAQFYKSAFAVAVILRRR